MNRNMNRFTVFLVQAAAYILTGIIVLSLIAGHPPSGSAELSHMLDRPVYVLRGLLVALVVAGIVSEVVGWLLSRK